MTGAPLLLSLLGCVPELPFLSADTAPLHTGTPPTIYAGTPTLRHDEWALVTWLGDQAGTATGMALTPMEPYDPAVRAPVLAVGAPGLRDDGVVDTVYVLYSTILALYQSELATSDTADTGDHRDQRPQLTTIRNSMPEQLTSLVTSPPGQSRDGRYLGWVPQAGSIERQLVVGSPHAESSKGTVVSTFVCGIPNCTADLEWSLASPGGLLGWAVEPFSPGHVLLGAPGHTANQQTGRVHLQQLPGATWGDPVTWHSDDPTTQAGFSLASTDFGCADCDDRDVVVGASKNKGVVYVLLDALDDGDGSLAALADVIFEGDATTSTGDLGAALHIADLDIDGRPDLLMGDGEHWFVVPGAWFAETPTPARLGVADAASFSLTLSTEGLSGTQPSCEAATTGDYNDDGAVDLAIGGCDHADGLDRVYVVLGPISLTGDHLLHEVADLVLLGLGDQDEVGSAMATIPSPVGPDLLAVGHWQLDLVADENRGAVSVVSPSAFQP